MSKFTKKAMMAAVLISAGASQVYACCWSKASIVNIENDLISGLKTAEQNVVAVFTKVKADVPELNAYGTELISVLKVYAQTTNNTGLLNILNASQNVLNGATKTIESKSIIDAINNIEQTVLSIDPNAKGGIDKVNDQITAIKPVVDLVTPLIEIAINKTPSSDATKSTTRLANS
jgi:hypothetical protein